MRTTRGLSPLLIALAFGCGDPSPDELADVGVGTPPIDATPEVGPDGSPDSASERVGHPTFTEVGLAAGLDVEQQSSGPCGVDFASCEASQMTGGAAIGDVDGDGFDDVYLTRLDGPGVLFRNRGDGTFEDVTEEHGLAELGAATNGAAFADLDRDGDLDLYVTTFADDLTPPRDRFVLFLREGARFEDRTLERGAGIRSNARRTGFSIATGDYDLDGHIDLHVTEWQNLGLASPPHTRLLHNVGGSEPGTFRDDTRVVGVSMVTDGCWDGIAPCDNVAFASAFSDLDGDGLPDLLVAADFGLSRLFWNAGDGSFEDGTSAAGVGLEENAMGSTVGDYDNDGDLDWFVTSIGDPFESCGESACTWGYSGNRLYRNDGGRRFTDVTEEAGVRMGGWGWGAAFFDYDNDGDLDLIMTNGIELPMDRQEDHFNDDLSRFWENVGGGRFEERSVEVGLSDRVTGKGLVVFDYDRDGDQDVLVVVTGARPLLYRNDGGSDTPSLRVRLEARESAPEGLGARVRVRVEEGGPVQLREMGSVSHFLGQSERVAHFGLGAETTLVAEVVVTWPSGRESRETDVGPGELVIVEPSGS